MDSGALLISVTKSNRSHPVYPMAATPRRSNSSVWHPLLDYWTWHHVCNRYEKPRLSETFLGFRHLENQNIKRPSFEQLRLRHTGSRCLDQRQPTILKSHWTKKKTANSFRTTWNAPNPIPFFSKCPKLTIALSKLIHIMPCSAAQSSSLLEAISTQPHRCRPLWFVSKSSPPGRPMAFNSAWERKAEKYMA